MIMTTTIRTQSPAGTVLHVAGEVDTCAADGLRASLRRLAARPSGVVVVDLAGVTFMSCSALAVLAQAKRQLGARLLLGETSRIVARLLEVTGWTSFFPTPTEDGADPALDGPDRSRDGGAPPTRAREAATWSSSRTDVHRACGMLMEIHACNAEQAWSMLARAARRSGVPVGNLVELLVRAREDPDRLASSAAAVAALTTTREPVDHAPQDREPAGNVAASRSEIPANR